MNREKTARPFRASERSISTIFFWHQVSLRMESWWSNNCSTMLATIWRRIWSGPSFCLANGFSKHIIIRWSTRVCWEQVSCDLLTWRTGFEAREGTWPRLNIRRIRKKSEQVLKSVDSGSNWFWKLTLTTCAASRSRRYENGMAEIENSIDWP